MGKHDDAKLLSWVDKIDESIYAMAGGAAEDGVGTGGMRTKVEAAEKAVSHGIDTFIINGFTELSFNLMLEGQNPGTHIQAHEKPMKENVHWMAHTSNAQGEVVIKEAFSVGDTILVRREDGVKLAKAKSNYSSCLLNFIANEGNQKFASEFEEKTGPIISEQHIAVLENK